MYTCKCETLLRLIVVGKYTNITACLGVVGRCRPELLERPSDEGTVACRSSLLRSCRLPSSSSTLLVLLKE